MPRLVGATIRGHYIRYKGIFILPIRENPCNPCLRRSGYAQAGVATSAYLRLKFQLSFETAVYTSTGLPPSPRRLRRAGSVTTALH